MSSVRGLGAAPWEGSGGREADAAQVGGVSQEADAVRVGGATREADVLREADVSLRRTNGGREADAAREGSAPQETRVASVGIAREAGASRPRMRAHELSAGYDGVPVLEDFDFEVPAGKVTTLVGANGSGKSTVLKAMSRLIAPTSGVVYLEGESIHRMPTRLVAQKLALLPQGAQVPAGITVRDLVEYGRFPHRTRFAATAATAATTASDHEVIDWALACTHMTELADRDMDQLSGGQRQRGWIAMTLAQRTGILFLDEPTTYLDISHQLEVLQLLRQLNRDQGTTIVMVLHDLNHAIMFSDCLVAIKDGRRCCAGTPREIITPQTLMTVFDVEAEIIEHPVLGVPVCLPYALRDQTPADRQPG